MRDAVRCEHIWRSSTWRWVLDWSWVVQYRLGDAIVVHKEHHTSRLVQVHMVRVGHDGAWASWWVRVCHRLCSLLNDALTSRDDHAEAQQWPHR